MGVQGKLRVAMLGGGSWGTTVAALTARTCAEGAYLNVKINLPGIQDEAFKSKTLAEAAKVRAEIVTHTEETVKRAEQILSETE